MSDEAELKQPRAKIVTVDNSQVMYQLRKAKDRLAEAEKDRDAFKAEADQYRNDNVLLKEKVDNSVAAKRVAQLEGQLKEISYREKWNKVAKAKGIREDALDAAYQLGGYKPEGDDFDEIVVGQAIEDQKSRQSFLAGKTEELPVTKETKKAPGSGQGGALSSSGAFGIPADGDGRWDDPVWQWKNKEKLAEAYKEKHEKGVV